jgi:hypothetical protein
MLSHFSAAAHQEMNRLVANLWRDAKFVTTNGLLIAGGSALTLSAACFFSSKYMTKKMPAIAADPQARFNMPHHMQTINTNRSASRDYFALGTGLCLVGFYAKNKFK